MFIMKYIYCPNDVEYFATDLRRVTGTNRLTWKNTHGIDVLLIQTAFGIKAEDLIQDILKKCSEKTLTAGE